MDIEGKMAGLSREYAGVKRIALSYSGGLDSVVIANLLKNSGFGVLPVIVDLGQKSDFARVRKNAVKMFGSCSYVDAKPMLSDAIARAVKSNFGKGGAMSGGGLTRPIIALCLANEARRLGCDSIAHGASGAGNDHIILENSLRVLAPELRILAPVRDCDLRRDEAISYAKKEGLLTNLERASHFSVDESLWSRTIRQGQASEIEKPLGEAAYAWTSSPSKAPSKPASIVVEFENGIFVSARIGGRKFSGQARIIEELNRVGGIHGVGRSDSLSDKLAGLKVREVYEAPAAQILLAAHCDLESLVLTTRELDVKSGLDSIWTRRVHHGGWHTRLRRAIDAFTDELSRAVDGSVELEVGKGAIRVKGRKSRRALYDARLSSRDSKGVFSQKEARAFAKLYGLQEVIAYLVDVDG